jgi:hypothetical protein
MPRGDSVPPWAQAAIDVIVKTVRNSIIFFICLPVSLVIVFVGDLFKPSSGFRVAADTGYGKVNKTAVPRSAVPVLNARWNDNYIAFA